MRAGKVCQRACVKNCILRFVMPRYGTVEEVAGLIAYLAVPEAGYITGASLMMDGGFSA